MLKLSPGAGDGTGTGEKVGRGLEVLQWLLNVMGETQGETVSVVTSFCSQMTIWLVLRWLCLEVSVVLLRSM